MTIRDLKLLIVATIGTACCFASAQNKDGKKPDSETFKWTFAVSGDSRNCGDVIMPAIAAGARENNAEFYWHLGDLRATAFIDEDYLHEPEHRDPAPAKTYYDKTEWDDFIQSQLNFFGPMPVYVGIGNHETYPPKSREQFIIQFADWLDSPALRAQRLADNPNDHALKSFFHWIRDGVDFIYLDNSTKDQFDSYQLGWFEGVLQRAAANPDIKTVVVGMHAALPDSLASGHSMNDWDVGTQSGRQVYEDLLKFRQGGKHVYVLASHSHFLMSGIFDSDYWRAHGGVLPGWIVGTAGAMRYPLPATADRAKEARTKIYGYLLGSVRPDGTIDFKFQEIKREDIPGSVSQRFSPQFVDVCFNQNIDLRPAAAPAQNKNKDDLSTVIAAMNRNAAAFKNLQADFEWETYNAALKEKDQDVQTGKSYFRKGNDLSAKLDVEAPTPKQVLYQDGVVSFYEPKPNRLTKRDVGNNKADVDAAMSLGFGGRGDDLLKAYDVKFAGWEVLDGVRTAKLELASKNPHGSFSKAVIWIDPEKDIALEQQFFSTSGDYRLIRYHNLKFNGGMSDNEFKLRTHGKPEVVSQ